MDGEMISLQGTIEDIVFHNENNGWTVLEISSGHELVTVVGTFFQIAEGDGLRVLGEWVTHPSYGRQFKAETFERSRPETSSAVLKYLSSGVIKGIGPSTAKKIVTAFGEKSLEVIEDHPGRLAEIRGISPAKAALMGKELKSQFGMRSCMLFLQQYDVTPAEAVRIWKKWGADAVNRVKEDPYILCAAGISFEKVDAAAMKMGVDKADSHRICAGLLHVLRHNLFSGGHTYIPADKLSATSAQMLGCGPEEAEAGIEELAGNEQAVVEAIGETKAVFLPEVYQAEKYIAGRLQLFSQITPPEPASFAAKIQKAEKEFGIRYAQKQREAITAACGKGLMILTGGPGTGKTTTINALIQIYEEMGLKVALTAPTGRAAKRMSEVSGREAKTIHRLLEMEYTADDTPHFSRDERNPLDCDALIVDELSMVDVPLFASLLRALRLNCRLVMVGDADQLPPVGPGNVLRDMIASGRIAVVALNEIFRQASESLIVTNAHRIVRGEPPDLASRDRDFFFMPRYTPAQVARTVRDLVEVRLPAAYGYSPVWDIQVLAPGRKGELGTGEINEMLREALNPPSREKTEIRLNGRIFREEDKVMQIRNNYDIVWKKGDGERGSGVFNGDIGVVQSIDKRTGSFTIRFDDRQADYAPENSGEIEPAYAITVHKSQGSEFKAVVLPLFSGASQLFYRNLLYTAVTRAREMVVIVGREQAVLSMVANNKKTKRYTALDAFLKDACS